MRAKQTNQKYDEAEQKSQAWMKAKDEAQSHKRMWHSYWQQAMVSFSLHVVPVLQVLPVYVLCTCKDLVLAKRIPIATSRLWLLPCQQRTLKQFCRTNKPTFAILAAAPSICYALL